LGVNLRSDPCAGATALGFIPAGANMIVTGWPNGDYTPVRINKDVIQDPLDAQVRPWLLPEDSLGGGPTGVATPTATPVISPTLTVTPTITATSTVTATMTVTATSTTTDDS
jgi:hypothetical protein